MLSSMSRPLLIFTPIFMLWMVLPFGPDWVLSDLDIGLFYIVAILGLSVVGHVLAGWASNNKYALLGSARNAAQLISYELPLVFAVLAVGLLAQTATDRPFSLAGIVEAQGSVPYLVIMPLGFILFLVGALAETARIPFDIPHAEEEIVGGAFVEYSGIRWGVFFLTEYAGLATMAFLATILFLGGWTGPVLRAGPDPSALLPVGEDGRNHPHRVLDTRAAASPPHRPAHGVRVETGNPGIAREPHWSWRLSSGYNTRTVGSMWLTSVTISVISIVLAVGTGIFIQRRREQRLRQFRQRWAQ